MSHSVVWVLLNGKTKPAGVEKAIEKALAPFDERTEVKPYKKQCHCVGSKAQLEVMTKAGTRNAIDRARAKLREDPANAEILRDGDDFANLEKLGITRAQWKAANRELNRRWQALIDPHLAREKKMLEAHPLKDKSDPGCEDCKGSGKVKSTYNPKSKWDWYVIGGRWAGTIRGVEATLPDDENPFTTGDHASAERKTAQRNSVLANSLPVSEMATPIDEDKIPFAILTPDGEWHERGRMGWFGMVSGDKEDNWTEEAREILSKHKACLAVAVDVHI